MRRFVLIEKHKIKKCNHCNNLLPLTIDFFQKRKESKTGFREKCKNCSSDYIKLKNKKYYAENKEIIRADYKKYYKDNKEKINKIHKEYHHKNYNTLKVKKNEYRKNNKSKIRKNKRQYTKERYKNDKFFKFTKKIRDIIGKSFRNKNFIKNSKTHQILGCTYEQFKEHIEKQFLYWMNWSNYGLYNGELNFGWDFDHIIPISSAMTEGDVIKLNHYTNFQPLCSKVNRDIKRDELNFKLEFQAS